MDINPFLGAYGRWGFSVKKRFSVWLRPLNYLFVFHLDSIDRLGSSGLWGLLAGSWDCCGDRDGFRPSSDLVTFLHPLERWLDVGDNVRLNEWVYYHCRHVSSVGPGRPRYGTLMDPPLVPNRTSPPPPRGDSARADDIPLDANTDLDKIYQVYRSGQSPNKTNTQKCWQVSTRFYHHRSKKMWSYSSIAMTAQNGTQTTAPSYLP